MVYYSLYPGLFLLLFSEIVLAFEKLAFTHSGKVGLQE